MLNIEDGVAEKGGARWGDVNHYVNRSKVSSQDNRHKDCGSAASAGAIAPCWYAVCINDVFGL